MSILNEQESRVMDLLACAWNAFCALEEIHYNHSVDFNQAIHAAQHIIMARPASREYVTAEDEAFIPREFDVKLVDGKLTGFPR